MKTLLGLFLTMQFSFAADATGFLFECDETPSFRIDTTGRFYGDQVYINGSKELIAPLVGANREINNDKIWMSLGMQSGQCHNGSSEKELVNCQFDNSTAWEVSHFGFSTFQTVDNDPATLEYAQITRSVRLLHLELSVTKEPGAGPVNKDSEVAILKMKIKLEQFKKQYEYEYTARLGEWTNQQDRSNYDRCVFTNSIPR